MFHVSCYYFGFSTYFLFWNFWCINTTINKNIWISGQIRAYIEFERPTMGVSVDRKCWRQGLGDRPWIDERSDGGRGSKEKQGIESIQERKIKPFTF